MVEEKPRRENFFEKINRQIDAERQAKIDDEDIRVLKRELERARRLGKQEIIDAAEGRFLKNMDKKGLTIIYIGDGKGKTTAAVGLAVRAAGTGKKVLFLQFVKGDWISGERKILESLPNVTVKILGKGFVGILGDQKPLAEHIKAALGALNQAKQALISGVYDVVILDEAISAIESKLITVEDLLDLIKNKPEPIHLCLTGHKRIRKLIDLADLVTEMKMIKHPYYKGILAQKGIDY